MDYAVAERCPQKAATYTHDVPPLTARVRNRTEFKPRDQTFGCLTACANEAEPYAIHISGGEASAL
jgi:hypothetical protein